MIQLLECIEGIQREHGYGEYEEWEKAFTEDWAIAQCEDPECEKEEVRTLKGR